MLRLLLALVVAAGCLAAAEPSGHDASGHAASVPATSAEVDRQVALFNPEVWKLDEKKQPILKLDDPFNTPASDVARRIASDFWFSLLIFSPFLILPQILLLVIIFKFRDRGDGRKAATFSGNHLLEVVWTAVPCVALVIVTVPSVQTIIWMEFPPDAARRDVVPVEVIGKQFSWKYRYMREDHAALIGLDVAGLQEPLVLPKDRIAVLNLTSEDVNHAWWIPAFGVKKDAIIGRHTNVWFTPDRVGTFKGQCAELCGNDHGRMIITAVITDAADYELWVEHLRYRNAALKIWSLVRDPLAKPEQVDAAVAKYLAVDSSVAAKNALRFWIATNHASLLRGKGQGPNKDQLKSESRRDRERIDGLLNLTARRTTQEAAP
ncbi:hypothetical protein LBMAG53_36090 [Planctomycetota bacterium]|nr:hypothetical protein LBMAG53_36090 [Planctomycetota bacterium]